MEFHSEDMKIYGCPSDNHVNIFGCPATFLVGARTTKISNAAYIIRMFNSGVAELALKVHNFGK